MSGVDGPQERPPGGDPGGPDTPRARAQPPPDDSEELSAELRAAAELVELEDAAARRQWLGEHRHLLATDLVEAICAHAASTTAVDPVAGGRWADAALAIAAELGDDRCLGLGLRALGNALLFQRDYRGAQRRYEEAIERFEAAGDEVGAAVARGTAIHSLAHLGQYERVLEWAAVARRALEASGDRLRVARLEFNLGVVLSRQDRFQEALAHFRSAHQEFLALGQPRDVGMALRNLAVCYQDLNDFHASLRTYEEARDYCREQGLDLIGLEVQYNIAYLFYLRGEYSKAIGLFEKARSICRRLEDRHHESLCDLDQAEIYLLLNLIDEADAMAGSAAAGFERLGMGYEMAKALFFRATAADRRGDSDRAAELLGRARQVFAEQEKNLVWVGMVDLQRARLLRSDGRLDEALHSARLAREALEAVPSRAVQSELLLARLALDRQELGEARARVTAALHRLRELAMPLHDYEANLVAGQLAERAGEPAAARTAYERAVDSLERLQGGLATDELRIAFAGGTQSVYGLLVRLALAGRPSAEARAEAFRWIERAKSRSLATLLAGAPHLRSTGSGKGRLAAEVVELRDEVNWFYRRIDREEMSSGSRSIERLEELRRAARERETRLLGRLRRLQAIDPELAAARGSYTVDLPTLQQILPEDSLLLEYFASGDELYACVVGADRLDVYRLGELSAVLAMQRTLRMQLSKFALGADYLERFGEHAARAARQALSLLYAKLLGPLAGELSCRRLIVVPHGALHQVPFQALFDGERHLIDRYCLSYAASATVLELCRVRRLEPQARELVMGVPDARAPQIGDEARAVAAALPNARLLLGDEVTLESLSRLGQGARIVHLAAHGHFRADNPMFSAIQLGDSRLSLLDLYDLRLNAELVVLSGCGTGLSEVAGGDELVGLTRGLLYAGSRAVVATLWDVNDESTSQLMVSFYRHLRTEPDPAAALRRAQLELRERFADPYYWAPFVLAGWPGPGSPDSLRRK